MLVAQKKELNALMAEYNEKIHKLEFKIRQQTVDLQNTKQDYQNVHSKQDALNRANEK